MLRAGECEPLKAGLHGVALGLVGTFAAYNALAWWKRREAHLACNVVLYTVLFVWEANHVRHHLRALQERRCSE